MRTPVLALIPEQTVYALIFHYLDQSLNGVVLETGHEEFVAEEPELDEI
jgi:hypothetical protein